VQLDGSTATGVVDFDLDGIIDDITFVEDSYFDLSPQGQFRFLTRFPEATDAADDLVAFLNMTAATSVGPSAAQGSTFFHIAFNYDSVKIFTRSGRYFGRSWQSIGTTTPGVTQDVVYAVFNHPFDIPPVPVPAGVWLFGSALGLLGWMRRKAA
jgi:hypothetical protein